MTAVTTDLSGHTVTRSWVPFVALETAAGLAAVGNGVSVIAIPWLVLELTGSPAAAGLVAGIAALPLLLSSLFSGTLVDRLGRRRTSVFSDVMSGLSVAAIPVVALAGHLTLTWILVLAALGAVFDPAGVTARKAMLPEAAEAAGLSLARANGVHEAVYGVGFLVGPGAAGVLIALIGARTTMWATTSAFLAAAAAMLMVRVPGSGRPGAHARTESFLADTVEGLRFVWNDHALRGLTALFTVLIGAWMPIEGVLLPVFFQRQNQPEHLGVLFIAMSAGGVIGSLAYSAFGGRFRHRPALLVSLAATALPTAAMALLPPYVPLLVLAALSGLFFGPIPPITNIVLQQRTPELLRGRVIGTVTSLSYAAGPLGLMVAGPLVVAVGLRGAFAVLAGVIVLVALLASAMKSLHLLDESADAPQR